MVNLFKWLQLFAEGAGDGAGDGGAAAATGVDSVDAGHQRLRELGVPENRIRKNRTYTSKSQTPAPQSAAAESNAPAQVQQAVAADDQKPTEEAAPAATRMSWEEICNDPEYKEQISRLVRSRVKDSRAAEQAMSVLTPWLKNLAKEHDLDPENIDYESLVKSASGEYANKAIELGVSEKIARQLDQQQRTLEMQRMDSHYRRLKQQGEQLKATFPSFDLRTEMQNPVFARLVDTKIGLSVEDAFNALHHKEIQAAAMQVAAQKAAEEFSKSIQSGSRRPEESGAASQAPSVPTFDYRKMSKAERQAFKNRIYSGEKIYPGQM